MHHRDRSDVQEALQSRKRQLRRGLRRCPKCTGNLMFEADVTEGLLLLKCLQCGMIESYFWLERRTNTLVYMPPENDLLTGADAP